MGKYNLVASCRRMKSMEIGVNNFETLKKTWLEMYLTQLYANVPE